MSINKWYNKSAQADDPIAQTFRVLPEHCPDADGCFISAVDLFFESKSSIMGCTVDIRATDEGYPTRTVIPFSSVHLEPDQIRTSADASAATRVFMRGPVFLKAGQMYAISIKPDGNLPDLKAWVSINGRTDIRTSAISTDNWGDGAYFSSAASVWKPQLDRDLTFRLYRGKFDSTTTGTVTLTNRDLEFLTVLMDTGTLTPGEDCYKEPAAFDAGTVTTVVGNVTVTGVSTAFSTDYQSGESIVVQDSADANIADVITIKSIESATSMTILGGARVGIASGNSALTPTGRVQKYDANTGTLTIKDSTTANTSHRLAAADTIKGVTSAAIANVQSVDNRVISYYQPHLYRTEVSGSRVISRITYTKSDDLTTNAQRQIYFGLNNPITGFEAAVFSKSNEANTTGITKSLVITNSLISANPTVTPSLDSPVSCLQIYENKISANTTGEREFGQGYANSKYISKLVTLASGLEADDLNVYLTAYRPETTDIEVYAKFINIADADNPVQRQWTKLEIADGQDQLFSAGNRAGDLREFKFVLPASPTLESDNQQTGTANTTATSNVVPIASASTYYSAGDLIIVTEGLRSDYVLGRVSASNTTAVELYNAADKTFSNGVHYLVNSDESRSAFKYPLGSESYRLTYFDSLGREYNNYNYFQIKVVLLADQSNLVPRVADMRAIALTA